MTFKNSKSMYLSNSKNTKQIFLIRQLHASLLLKSYSEKIAKVITWTMCR